MCLISKTVATWGVGMGVSGEPKSLNIEHVGAIYDCPNQIRPPKSRTCGNRAVVDRTVTGMKRAAIDRGLEPFSGD